MTTLPDTATLDSDAVARWPIRASAHLLGIGLLLAVVVALPVAPTDLDRHQLPKESVVHLATWLAIVLVRPFPLRLPGRALAWALTLLLAVTIVSGVFAGNPWLAFRGTSLTVTLVCAFLLAHHLTAAGGGRIVAGWCLAAAAIGVLGGLGQAYGLDLPIFAQTRVPGGTFGNRNFLAHFCALALPMVLLPTLTVPKRLNATVGMVLAALLITAIVLTRSRAAWLGASSGAAIMAAGLHWFRHKGLPIVAGRPARLATALAIGALLAVALPNALAWKSDAPYRDTLAGLANAQEGSGRGRMLQYQHSLQLLIQHPVLGVGPGNWPIRYGEVAPPNDPSWVQGDMIPLNPWPSSDWIALLSERGPIALLAVLLFVVALLVHARRGLEYGGERTLAATGLLALLVTVAVEGTFDAIMLLAVPGMLAALMAGVFLCRADSNVVASGPLQPTPPRWSRIVPIVMGIIALRSVQQTTAYIVAGDGRSTSRVKNAAVIDPGSYALRMTLAARGSCVDARAALKLAPLWPAPKAAARRCGNRD